ncbi:MAG TPA: FAD-binding oxidoreductase [Pirellulales bacterium]|jgi:glycolate oxidase FAD binding subunit|nr:FAD-binding oxidoreductase [Pirellulales bacterium]
MTTVADSLPLTETIVPRDQQSLVEAIARAHAAGTPIYPIGGGTSLDFGLAPTSEGIGISLSALNRVIDYPARDMTITVEAGITMAHLADVLGAERQWLPIDVPHPQRATVGGVIATAWSGARRYGYGTPRDYVIGITAVDGRGRAFKGGGRVVKNVAGYDFCKLLTGSLGTLGVISQVTLKIKPQPAASAFLVCDLRDFDTAERLLAALVNSATTPAAIELLTGPYWHENAALGLATAGTLGRLAVGLEGTHNEVEWMLDQLDAEWRDLGITTSHAMSGSQAAGLWTMLAEFPSAHEAPLVFKASVLTSRTIEMVRTIRECDPQASIQAHAGNGVVIARFAKFDTGDVSRMLVGRLQPAASLAGGHGVVLSSTLAGLTRQAVWGGVGADVAWMDKVQRQFDPQGLLNSGRFVYLRG